MLILGSGSFPRGLLHHCPVCTGGPGPVPAKLFQDLETLPTEGLFTHQPYLVHTTDENGRGWFPPRTPEIMTPLSMGLVSRVLPLERHQLLPSGRRVPWSSLPPGSHGHCSPHISFENTALIYHVLV